MNNNKGMMIITIMLRIFLTNRIQKNVIITKNKIEISMKEKTLKIIIIVNIMNIQ